MTTLIAAGLIWLIGGIYRKNRTALTVSILVFPIIWLLEADAVVPHHGVISGIITVFSLGIAVLIAWVYLQEPKRQ